MLRRIFGGVAAVPADIRSKFDPNPGLDNIGGRSEDIPPLHGVAAGSEVDFPVPLPDGGGQFEVLHGDCQITIERSECNPKLRRWVI